MSNYFTIKHSDIRDFNNNSKSLKNNLNKIMKNTTLQISYEFKTYHITITNFKKENYYRDYSNFFGNHV